MSHDKLVVVTDDRFGDYSIEERVLREAGARLDVCKGSSVEELAARCREADALLVNLARIPASFIAGLPRCRILSRYGVGFDAVDVQAAAAAGIWVSNVPDYATEEVSDHAVALFLSCLRATAYRDRIIRTGQWNFASPLPVRRIRGKTFGLLGFGAIARAVLRKLRGFEMRFLVHDPYVSEAQIRENGATPASLDALLEQSDYLSVHVPLSAATKHLVSAAQFARMKRGAVLVNTSRGAVLDEQALIAALRSGTLSGAGLDVFESEPLAADSPLRGMDNVVLSDHYAYASVESVMELKEKAARNIAEVLRGNRPLYPVNAPASPRGSSAE